MPAPAGRPASDPGTESALRLERRLHLPSSSGPDGAVAGAMPMDSTRVTKKEARTMSEKLRLSRRGLGCLLALAALSAATGVRAGAARAADLKEVRFSEAVHNLGYINLYVGMHAGIFEKNGLKMDVSAAGGDTQTFAAVLGGWADFAIGAATMVQMSREAGGPGVVVGTVVQRAHYFGVSKNLQPIG